MATDVSSSLPQVDLNPQSTLTVTLDQAGATITGIWVHGWQDSPDDSTGTSTGGPVFLIPGPATG